jgi:putative NADPH-quinone reductase
MNILIILSHPEPHSFNYAIAETAKKRLVENGHSIMFHDLYEEKFDPVIYAAEIPKNAILEENIAKHCSDLANSDGIIIIHPNWWGQPPAILKGWIDRIIRPGLAYEFLEGDDGEGVPVGLLKAKTGIVFNTSNTSEVRENTIFKDPLETIWKNCILDFCGIRTFYRKMFRIMVTSSPEQREQWLEEVKETIDRYFPKNMRIY